MTLDTNEVGKALEQATRLIEESILSDIRRKDIGTITIENNKLFNINGVRHEIDVYVSIDMKIGTSLTYIFECRNRKNSVSKNDIIGFNKKIDIANAQKGYFIAKKFGKDSINQAKEYSRIKLLKVTSGIYQTSPFRYNYALNINPFIETIPDYKFEGNINLPVVLDNGETYTLGTLIKENLKEIRSHRPGNSKYLKSFKTTENGDQNDLTILYLYPNASLNDIPLKKLILKIETSFKWEYAQIIYDFSIQEKGKYIKVKFRDTFVSTRFHTLEYASSDKGFTLCISTKF